METILLIVRLFLFGVFALAGVGKLLDLRGSEKAVRDFGVPAGLAGTAAVLLPVTELVIAVSLLFVGSSWIASIAALLLLLIFIGGMLYQMAQGKAPDCHCFGQIYSEPVSKTSLIRNIGIAALALLVAVQGSSNQGLSLGQSNESIVQALLTIAVIFVLAVVLFSLRSIADQQTQIIRRLEMLEILGGDGSSQERQDAGNPEDALPIGAPFPDFELTNASGRNVSFEHLLARSKPTLFFMLGPNCTPCKALYPEIQKWSDDLAGRIQFVIVSSGTAEENIERFPGELGKEALLQANRELAQKIHAKWTPTAIYVDADGDIASHPAVGDTAIRELVENVSSADLSRLYTYFASPAIKRTVKIGKHIPEKTVTLLDGSEFNTAELKDKLTLAVFWSLDCPHCRQMLDELKSWEQTRTAGDPELLIFADGDIEELKETGLTSRLVVDRKYATAAEFGMHGTPSAVLVDANGVISTEIAIGSPNIWSLVGRKL